jgi:hypothetical protein
MNKKIKQNPKNNFGPLDYKKYKTAGEFYKANLGKVPIQMMHGISKFQEKENLTFQEAFKILLENKKIILIE